MEICTSHFKEDLKWLEGSPWPVNVVTHEGGDDIVSFKSITKIPNVGNEATAYLRYIIDRYDTLPEFTVFLHGHEQSHHQNAGRHMIQLIKDANVEKYSFIPLNNTWRHVQPQAKLGAHIHFLKRSGLLELLPEAYIHDRAAQFIVSKSRILSRPRSFYENIYEAVRESEDGIGMEFSWGVIFGMKTVPMHEDYFSPPLEKFTYFPNEPFPNEKSPEIMFINCPLQVRENITTEEEYDSMNDRGIYFIQFGNKVDRPCLFTCDEKRKYTSDDINYIRHELCLINQNFLSEILNDPV